MKKRIQTIWRFLLISVAITLMILFISCSEVTVTVEIPQISQGEILNEYVTITTTNATPSEHNTEENPIVADESVPFDFEIKKSDGIQYTVTFRGKAQAPLTDTVDETRYAYSLDLSQTASGTYAIIISASNQASTRHSSRDEEQAQIWIKVQNTPPVKPENISPEDGADNQPIQDLLFTWEAVNDPDEGDEVFYLFLLGTSEENLTLQATPTQNTYTHPGPLEYDTQYFWQVLAEDGKKILARESTAGDIWQFTTEQEPPKVTLTVQSQPQSGGDVKIGERAWSKEADVEVYEGTSKTISSRSAPDYLFDGWYLGEDLVSRETTYDVHVEEDTIYQAHFVEIGAFQPPEMIYVAKTSYLRSGNEVTLTYGYRISKTEVTINQYHAFQNAFQNDSQFSAREANRPVAMVDWLDAVTFCNWLSVQDGLAPAYDNEGNLLSANGQITQDIKTVEGYRLPTEAEWELAARGGGWPSGDYQYSGSDIIGDVAWYAANSNADGTGPRAQPVGGKLANDLGLYDMSGNVREWCHDWHGAYPQSHQEDPVGAEAGTQRVIRGGGWDSAADACLVGARDQDLPDTTAENLGFRVAKTELPSDEELVIRWKEDNPPAPPHRPPIEGDKTVEEIVANKPVASLVVTVNDEETIIEEPQHVEETQAGEHVYAAPVENLQQDEDNPVEVVAKDDNDQPSNEIKRNFPWKPIITNVQAEVGECEANQCVVVVRFNSNQEISQIIHQIGGSEEETTINDPFSSPDENGIYSYSFSVTVDQGEFTIYFSAYGVNGQDAKSVSGFCDCNVPPKIDEEDYTVEVDECIDNECQVTIGIWVDQLLTHISIQTDGGDPQQQKAGNPASVLNSHRYEIVTSVGPGEHTIIVQGINANGTSNPLTVTVDCNCVIPTPDEPVISDLDYLLHECVEGECMLSIIFTSNQPIDKVQAQDDDNERVDYEDLDLLPSEEGEYRYQFFMSVTAGEHTIWFEGLNDNGRSNTLVITVDCVCVVPTPPTIAFDPEQPVDETTTEETAILHITSDQELDTLKITNNGQEQVINDPEFEKDGDEYKYQAEVPLVEGDNHIIVEGENENGTSEGLYDIIEKGRVPDFSFNPTPPAQVDNCVDGVCTYVIKIKDNTGEQNEDWKLTDIDISVGDGEFVEAELEQDEQGNYTIPVTLQEGENAITIAGYNRFGMESLSCTIECVCPKVPPTIAFDPEPPATSVVDEIELVINSDQVLEVLTIWNNSQPNVIESPESEQVGDEYQYQEQVVLQEGVNELEIQGENENGVSNLIGHNIEKGEPPVIGFGQQPPSQVTNCVEEECEVTLYISCENGYDVISYQVGEGDAMLLAGLMSDADGNYPITVTLQKGTNVITFTAKNEFGTSNTISCTIECVCDSPPPGYTLEQLIGETDIFSPIGIDFQPTYQSSPQRNLLRVLTKSVEDETQVLQGELSGEKFLDQYPNADLPNDAIGFAYNEDSNRDLLLLPDKVRTLNDEGASFNDIEFPDGYTGQPGQLDFDYGPNNTSFMTKDSNANSTLNVNGRSGNQQFPFDAGAIGLVNMHQASENDTLKNKTAMCELNVNLSGSRDSVQRVFTLDPITSATSTLFVIPLSHGTVIDILPDIFNDYETVQFIVTTVKNETEYWVNIYNQAGERLHAFKTHDLSDLEETSGETIFYKVIKATTFVDGKLYIMHSEFPGVQIWNPEE